MFKHTLVNKKKRFINKVIHKTIKDLIPSLFEDET